MSKVDEYTGNGMIVVSDGEVWAVDDSGLLHGLQRYNKK